MLIGKASVLTNNSSSFFRHLNQRSNTVNSSRCAREFQAITRVAAENFSSLLFEQALQDIAGDLMKEETVFDEQCCKEKQSEVHNFISTSTKPKNKTKQKNFCMVLYI